MKCPPNNHHTIECNYMVNVGGPWAADVAHLAGIGKKDHACSTMRVELPVRPRLRSVFVLRCPTGPVSDCPMVIDGIAYWRRDSSDTFIAGCSPPKVRFFASLILCFSFDLSFSQFIPLSSFLPSFISSIPPLLSFHFATVFLCSFHPSRIFLFLSPSSFSASRQRCRWS